MKATIRFKGGAGSGHHGHSGRPGQRGGSVPGFGSIGDLRILSDNVAVIKRENGSTIHIQGGQVAIDIFDETFQMLPQNAKELIRNSNADIKFFSGDHNKGSHIYSGEHRISIGSRLNERSKMEEWGHLLDKELGGRGKTDYSRKRVWQNLMKQEDARPKAFYSTGLASEDFAKTFSMYVLEPSKLRERYPLHYEAHNNLFGLQEKAFYKGGPGSGHHGHSGRPGQRGGSLPGGGSSYAQDYVDKLASERASVGGITRFGNMHPEERVAYFQRLGYTSEEIATMEVTLNNYGVSGPVQQQAMVDIVTNLRDKDSRQGALLRDQIALETALHNKYLAQLDEARAKNLDARRDDFDWAWERGEGITIDGTWYGPDRMFPEPKESVWAAASDMLNYQFDAMNTMLYRKGSVDRPVQSWTFLRGGAVMGGRGSGGIGWNHSMPMASVQDDGYRVIGGWSRSLGAPGEGEITLIKDLPIFNLKEIYKGGPGSGHHGHRGVPGHRGGSLPGEGSPNYLPKEERVWQGEQHEGTRQLTNIQTGEIGEALAAKALEDIYGVEFSTLNVGMNNAPIDLGGDHTAVEVKAGPATNVRTAHHWRATVSTEGKAERELVKHMTKEEKRAYNIWKGEQVLERKNGMLKEMSDIAGAPVKPVTVGVVLTGDGKRGDVFLIPGFHLRLPWKDYAVEDYYVGTYEYED